MCGFHSSIFESSYGTPRPPVAQVARVLTEYSTALMGDVTRLQTQLNEAMKERRPSMTFVEFKECMNALVKDRAVDTVDLCMRDQRRILLEAIAVGAYLRDAEDEITALSNKLLLTPNLPQTRA